MSPLCCRGGLATTGLLILVHCATLARAQTTDGLECFKCSSSRDLAYCLSRTETCSSGQTCFKEETMGTSSRVVDRYSMGCMDAAACARQPQSTARGLCDNPGQTCYSCCRDRSLCNSAPSSLTSAVGPRHVAVVLVLLWINSAWAIW